MAVPHVLIFPLPLQGHITPMLKLAELLSHSGILVTFINTHHNHRSLGGSIENYTKMGIHFVSVPDGLDDDVLCRADTLLEMWKSLSTKSVVVVRELVASATTPFTCVVADGVLEFMLDLAEEVGLPAVVFRTSSACSFWAYFCIPWLIDAGDVPFSDETDMDKQTNSVPGMEGLLRLRDLPSFCRTKDVNDVALQTIMRSTLRTTRTRGLILNTTTCLEPTALVEIHKHIPKIYSIGPLHLMTTPTSSSLWEKDDKCISWLDRQPPQSVIFVSLGSLAVPGKQDLLELWHGLVGSGYRFLWAIRPDLADKNLFQEKTEKCLVVGWAPQEEVLNHLAVGGFMTHSGWNSTLESICAGVPMLCWPFFVDQNINSRFVEKAWGIGLDMKDICERSVVEKMVRKLMSGDGDVMRKNIEKIREEVRSCVEENGTSRADLERLMCDIRAMSNEVASCSEK